MKLNLRTVIAPLSLCLLFVLLGGAAQARPIDPPLAALRMPQAIVVVGKVVSVQLEPAAFELEVSEVIRGRADARVSIGTELPVVRRLTVGKDYAVVYLGLQAVERKPGIYRTLELPRLFNADGAAVPIYADTPQIRELLAAEHLATEQRQDYLSIVRGQLQTADPQLLDLWTGELLLRDALRAQMNDADRSTMARLAADLDTPPPARARLLLASVSFPDQLGRDWAPAVARSILESAPVHAVADLYNPEEPVFAAFEVLNLSAEKPSVAVASRWLRTARPALAEQAALLIRAVDPLAERPAIQAALAETLLPAQTRLFLEDHLRRLDLADAL